MKKYVDINAIIKTMRHWKESVKTSDLIESFSKMPAVDVVEVVRCEECGYFHKNEKISFCDRPCEEPVQRFSHDFCSRGVRKNERT